MESLFFVGLIFVLGAFMKRVSCKFQMLNVIIATTMVHEILGPLFTKYALKSVSKNENKRVKNGK